MCKRRFEESYAREITATVSHHTTAQISQGWSKSKNTKLSSMGLPGFAERKLNELFEKGRNGHKVQPAIAREIVLNMEEYGSNRRSR
jgi:hypothetical protein